MSKCANCVANAIYTYQINESFAMHYCQSHLPRFLYAQRDAGNLAFKAEEEPTKSSKKKTTTSESSDESTTSEETPAGE
jgi:hypothetical protein